MNRWRTQAAWDVASRARGIKQHSWHQARRSPGLGAAAGSLGNPEPGPDCRVVSRASGMTRGGLIILTEQGQGWTSARQVPAPPAPSPAEDSQAW